ncbi:hypothetical protein [Microbacterium halotolerans]|uniref:hypothetical protein n=1 Tax=Microbacterium halotolerans TaxID=246613 RepID=UPI000E6AB379|nr:hypothetical protein [Microbacterium halotolerans]
MSAPQRFRKKPVEIEAMQLTRENVADVAAWCGGRVIKQVKPGDPTDVYVAAWCGGRVIEQVKPGDPTDVYVGLDIPTLEGTMRAETFHWSTWDGTRYVGGDWIIRGVQGEFYPCKPDIFEATYEAVR